MITEHSFVFPAEAISYLRVQRGNIGAIQSDLDFQQRYNHEIYRDYVEMIPHLPKECSCVVDVGGGMAGIDVLVAKHFRSVQGLMPHVVVLDGESDKPIVRRHSQTFSSRHVTNQFVHANGLTNLWHVSPQLATSGPDVAIGTMKADLVLSLAAWCFHIAPEVYLDFIRRFVSSEAILIIDIRKERPDWLKTMERVFGTSTVIRDERKYQRRVFDRLNDV